MQFKSVHPFESATQEYAFKRLKAAEMTMYNCSTIDELRMAAISYCNMMDAYYHQYGTIYLEGVEWDNRRRRERA